MAHPRRGTNQDQLDPKIIQVLFRAIDYGGYFSCVVFGADVRWRRCGSGGRHVAPAGIMAPLFGADLKVKWRSPRRDDVELAQPQQGQSGQSGQSAPDKSQPPTAINQSLGAQCAQCSNSDTGGDVIGTNSLGFGGPASR